MTKFRRSSYTQCLHEMTIPGGHTTQVDEVTSQHFVLQKLQRKNIPLYMPLPFAFQPPLLEKIKK